MTAPTRPVVSADFTTSVGGFTVQAAFDAGPGVTALFGASGSGKSITLATIAGLLRPSRGSIVIGNEVVADAERMAHVRTQDRRIGMVFQHAALLPHRSPLENISLATRGKSGAECKAVAEYWLTRVQGAHLSRTATRTLSGGEQQQVALARALAGEPRVLLLDEPFSALDHATRQSMRSLIRALVDEQKLTAIIVTHDLEDIAFLADRVVRYEPGRTTGVFDLRPGTSDQLVRVLGLDPTIDSRAAPPSSSGEISDARAVW